MTPHDRADDRPQRIRALVGVLDIESERRGLLRVHPDRGSDGLRDDRPSAG
jgi:hypothetical protein